MTSPVYPVLAMVSGGKKTRVRRDLEKAFHDCIEERNQGFSSSAQLSAPEPPARLCLKPASSMSTWFGQAASLWARKALSPQIGTLMLLPQDRGRHQAPPHVVHYKGTRSRMQRPCPHLPSERQLYDLNTVYTYFGWKEQYPEHDTVRVDLDPLLWQVGLKDQYHTTFNQSRALSWFNANFYILRLSSILAPYKVR